MTDFVLDGQSVVREMRRDTQSDLVPYATYLEGPTGPMYRRDDTTGSVRWYIYDGLGSVVAEVDPNGNVTSTRKYDVYGAVRGTTGTPTSKHAFVGQLGHTTEDETGLTYMRARYYGPAIGRFISEDPGRNGDNWFGYANAEPTNGADLTGKNFVADAMRALADRCFRLAKDYFREGEADIQVGGEIRMLADADAEPMTSAAAQDVAAAWFAKGEQSLSASIFWTTTGANLRNLAALIDCDDI